MPFKYMDANRPLNTGESFYLGEIVKGMVVTLRHFTQNAFWRKRETSTKAYPEERFPFSYRSRGRHYLTHRSDGRLSCVACQMCALACPANVITIEIGELPQPYYTERQKIDRYPKVFTIDQLSCIYCGMCVEACPEDAIRMDSGQAMIAVERREDAVITIDLLSQAPVPEHELLFNPAKGDEPAAAPLALVPAKSRKAREY